jgi:uncharacterized protein (TIGR02421 family)
VKRSGKTPTEGNDDFPARLIRVACRRLRENKRVRRSLPIWGRIHIDRQLPFLCIYRRPAKGNDAGTERLASSEASYLTCSGQRRLQAGLSDLVRAVAEILVEQFGACLLLEFWAAPPAVTEGPVTTAELIPEFRILATKGAANAAMTDEFEAALHRVKLGHRKAHVSGSLAAKSCPRSLPPILPTDVAANLGCLVYGLEISPVYRDAETGEVFPTVLRQFRRSLTMALRRAFFEFARKHTTHRPAHFHTLGRRAVVKAVWEVDRLLAEACDQFDFLLQLTPVNGEQAWQEFRRLHYQRKPAFHYRPLPAEPVVLKRNLYKAPVEQVEDPALAQVFREKIDEVDRQITMLQDRNTHRFLHESIQLFGGVEDDLLDLAVEILEKVPSRSRDEASKGQLSPEQFAERARAEIEFLRQQHPQMNANVEIRHDVSGLMVSRGNLLISSHSRIPPSRLEALIQHEVGTHVLTYHNGRNQPFRQLYTGLAGYDALQEGLAVLTEYLVGGLSRPRLRLLAARVIAARRMIDGATFVDTYRELDRNYDFARRTAFIVAMRIYRGGGLTKDAVYLRGLCQILDYFSKGGELEPLFVGKIAAQHIPIVRELLWRRVLHEPPLVPRYMSRPDVLEKLERLRKGISVMDFVLRSKK